MYENIDQRFLSCNPAKELNVKVVSLSPDILMGWSFFSSKHLVQQSLKIDGLQ